VIENARTLMCFQIFTQYIPLKLLPVVAEDLLHVLIELYPNHGNHVNGVRLHSISWTAAT